MRTTQPLQTPENQQLISQLADAMPHVVWIANPAGRVVYYNKRVADFLGVIHTPEGFWHWEGVLHPEDLQATSDAWNEAVKNGTLYEKEHRVIMKDGSFKWHLSRGIPQRDIDGNIIAWYGTATDIHDQKTASERIRESEERFRLLAETLPQLVWMTDGEGNQDYASSRWQAYTGIKPSGETTWQQIVHPDDLPVIASAWNQSMANGSLYKAEVRLKNKEGLYRWHSVQGEPLKNEAGEIIKWIGAFTDVNDQKSITEQLELLVEERTRELYESNLSLAERNSQLQLANKELESFNYVASHDLQEPLRKIQTFINLLQHTKYDEVTIQNYLNRINTSALRMSDLIKSVLDYGRLSKTDESFEVTDLNEIFEQVKADLEFLIDEKRATIDCHSLPKIRAVPIQMSQLFTNLISNSLKFSDKAPLIIISSSEVSAEQLPEPLASSIVQSYIQIMFQDNGIGFDQQYAQKIFSLFQRLHSKHLYAGTGIGLTICKRIVENHNGYIQAEGTPGQGATFLIYLPLGD